MLQKHILRPQYKEMNCFGCKPVVPVILLAGFFFLSTTNNAVNAQRYAIIEGKIIDSTQKKGLGAATIAIGYKANGKTLAKAVTRQDGSFTLKEIPQRDSLLLEVNLLGYEKFSGVLIVNRDNFLMAPVYLQPELKQLDGVVVKSQRPPVIIRADTTEFNAASYKTPPNSMAEDLIRRIPGLTFDNSGKLSFNGRPVNKILVDGKPFFGEDGTVALKNIPVDLIDKIQVHDLLSTLEKQVANAKPGIDDKKTLNIKLKKGDKYFGNVYGGLGSDKRYAVSGTGSYMRGERRIGLQSGYNNINQLRAGPPEVFSMSSGGGITRSFITRAEFGEGNTSFNYSYSRPNTFQESSRERRQNFYPGKRLSVFSGTNANNLSQDHNLGYRIGGPAASMGGSIAWVKQDFKTARQEQTMEGDTLVNSMNADSRQTGSDVRLNQDFRWLKRTGKWSLATTLDYNGSWTNSDNDNKSAVTFYRTGLPDSLALVSQRINQDNKLNNIALRSSVKYMLDSAWSLAFNPGINTQLNRSDKLTYNRDNRGVEHGIDSLFSSRLRNNNVLAQLNMGVDYNRKNNQFNVGVNLQQNHLASDNLMTGSRYRKTQFNLAPVVSYTNMATGITLRYQTDFTQPSVEQLQPAADNSNPLFVSIGNPDLKPELGRSFAVSFQKAGLNPESKRNLFTNLSADYKTINNKIVSYVQYDSLGKQTSQFRNVNGASALNLMFSEMFMSKAGVNNFSVGITGTGSYQRDKIFLNDYLNSVNRLTVSPALNAGYSSGNKLFVNLSYMPSFNKVSYELNASANQSYTTHNLTGMCNLFLFNKLKIQQTMLYNYNQSASADFGRSSLLWNMQLSYLCFKNLAEIKVTAFDVLKQNRNINRSIGDNYIEDTQSNNMQQYVMVGISYRLNKLVRNEQ